MLISAISIWTAGALDNSYSGISAFRGMVLCIDKCIYSGLSSALDLFFW